MGFKNEAKQRMTVGHPAKIHVGQMEYEGIVEKNTLISGDHNGVESDSCAVIRNDKEEEYYIIPLGTGLGIVLVVPFKQKE